jgi:hypothetical protein
MPATVSGWRMVTMKMMMRMMLKAMELRTVPEVERCA